MTGCHVSTALLIIGAACVSLAVPGESALAQRAGARDLKCEPWKGNEIRCVFEQGSVASNWKWQPAIHLTAKSGGTVKAKVNYWWSVCGLAGRHMGESNVDVGSARTRAGGVSFRVDQATYDAAAVAAKVGNKNYCVEVFVSCGNARCSDVVDVDKQGELQFDTSM